MSWGLEGGGETGYGGCVVMDPGEHCEQGGESQPHMVSAQLSGASRGGRGSQH